MNKEIYASREDFRAIAYVTVPASENWRWIGSEENGEVVSDVDIRYVTHINFAFGMIEAYQFDEGTDGRPLHDGKFVSREAFLNPEDGKYHYRATVNDWIEEMHARVDGRKYLKALADLKKKKPSLKVLVSIGGWESDGFCYMAKTPEGREEFAQSCADLIREYKLDGVDIDWEYPSRNGSENIASCPTCVDDARLLIADLRRILDKNFPDEHKLLSIASSASQPWMDEKTFPNLDYMNVMCYDYCPGEDCSQAGLVMAAIYMKNHVVKVGDTPFNRKKINLGIPFYNAGGPYLVPYWKEWSGFVDASPEITEDKMNWVRRHGYGGGFYWCYSMDAYENDGKGEPKILQRTLYETLNGQTQTA